MISETMKKAWIDGAAALASEHMELETCEVHAVVCGLIAGGASDDPSVYMPKISNIINSGEPLSSEIKEWILDFFKLVRSQFHDMETIEFPFEEEMTDPEVSVYFLSIWAEAFLVAFGCEIDRDEMDDSGKELVEEISNYTRLESGDEMSEEEFDDTLTTLIEHLKVCAMSLYADYGCRTGGKISIPKEFENSKYTRDGELVIGDEGISIEDLK
jgi:uncharacterized protein YgfB (UPF0149 family)